MKRGKQKPRERAYLVVEKRIRRKGAKWHPMWAIFDGTDKRKEEEVYLENLRKIHPLHEFQIMRYTPEGV